MAVLSTGEARVLSDPGYVAGRRTTGRQRRAGRLRRDHPARRARGAGQRELPRPGLRLLQRGFRSAFLRRRRVPRCVPGRARPRSRFALVGPARDPHDRAGRFRRRHHRPRHRREPGAARRRVQRQQPDFNALGTGYLGALGFATAQTPVSPGSHTLDLSILDRGDGDYDSGCCSTPCGCSAP